MIVIIIATMIVILIVTMIVILIVIEIVTIIVTIIVTRSNRLGNNARWLARQSEFKLEDLGYK